MSDQWHYITGCTGMRNCLVCSDGTLGSYPMDDVIQIAPAGDRSVSQYEREGVKVIDYTSHDKDTAYYDMVLKKEGETLLIKFEPDDKYLEAVEFKYRQKVIRRSTQA